MKTKIAFFVFALIVISPLLFYFAYKTQTKDASFEAFNQYREQIPLHNESPVLVYKSVDFYKYIVYGTKTDNVHSDKLIVYLVKGTASFGFDLSKIKIDTERSNPKNGKLYADFNSESLMPVFVSVSIPEAGIQEVESIEPKPYTEDEAKQIAKTLAIVGSGLGGFAGGIVGSTSAGIAASLLDGGLLPKPITKLTGASIGAGIAALATGITSYLCTKNFLLDYEATGYGFTEVQHILQASKGLIALELLEGANLIHTKEDLFHWENTKRAEQEKAILRASERLFQRFGWKEIQLSFHYPENKESTTSPIQMQENDVGDFDNEKEN